jgi:HlyD family secretion protein
MKQLFKQYWLGIVAALLVGVAAWMIAVKLHPKTLPSNLVEGVGRIDGDLIRLNVKYPGRVVKISVEEGMPIKKGDIVAILGSDETRAKLARAEAEAEARKKELAAKRTERAIAKKSVPLMLERAEARLQAALAQKRELTRNIEALQKVVEQDRRDLARSRNLFEKRLIQKELYEKAALKFQTDSDRLLALREKEKAAEASVRAARADLEDARASQKKIEALQESIEALEEGVRAVLKAKAEIEAVLDEMTVRSPVDGFVVEKIANEGEVLGGGMPVATLIDPGSYYLKIYLDTIENGKIAVGDKAVIFLDAAPDRPIEAKVVRIAQKAEFTPKEVSVRSDRIQRVYAVHLKPIEPDPMLKLGIPAIGVVSLDGKGLPRSLEDLPPL